MMTYTITMTVKVTSYTHFLPWRYTGIEKQIKQRVLEGFGNMQAGTADAAEVHSHKEILNYQH